MRAMVLERPGTPLVMQERAAPAPAAGEILVEVAACGVCRTDLHVVDGELANPKLPIVPGHEIVGRVDALGAGVAGLRIGERVGVPVARLHLRRMPLLSARAARTSATGRCSPATPATAAMPRHAIADARYCFPAWRRRTDDAEVAPFLCAGLIGWRSYGMAGEAQNARPLRVRRRRAHPCSGGGWQGRRVLCLHPAGRRGGTGASPDRSARSGPAARIRCRLSRSTPRSSLRRSARWCQWRSRR